MNIEEKYKKISYEMIETQINEIKKLYSLFETISIEKIINLLLNTKGKIIFSGIGKSGMIANKIASLFSSIGVSSFFINTNEAGHGDMGMISKSDTLFLLSNSGNSAEFDNLINYAKNNKIKIISITGKKDSLLYKKSDYTIMYNLDSEAIKNFPIPTCSITIMSLIGDILTGILCYQKKLTNLEYGTFHPAGEIGKLIKKK